MGIQVSIPTCIGITTGYIAGEYISPRAMYAAVILMPTLLLAKVMMKGLCYFHVVPMMSMKMKAAVSTRIYSTVRSSTVKSEL